MPDTIPDTIHSVQVIDTTYTKTEVFDTLYHRTEVYDTIRPQLLEVYQQLITAQDDKFDYILVTIGIIVTVLVILVVVFNVTIARQLFRTDARIVFRREANRFREEMDGQIALLTRRIDAETFKASSLTYISKKNWLSAVDNLFSALEIYSEIKDTDQINNILAGLKSLLKEAIDNKSKPNPQKMNLDEYKKVLEALPNNLDKSSLKSDVLSLLEEVFKIE